jgi:anti-sigma factor RsiW
VNCEETRTFYSSLADDELSPDHRGEVEAHLVACSDCRREWESFQRMLAMLHDLPRVRAPEGFMDRVRTAIRPAPWPRRLLRGLFVPVHVKVPLQAAALALVALGALYFTPRSPDPAVVAQSSEGPEPSSTMAQQPAAPPVTSSENGPESQGPAAEEPTRRSRASRELVAERTPTIVQPRAVPWPGIRTGIQPTVSGHLTVRDRRTAQQALTELLHRVGAIEVRRDVSDERTAVELEVEREAWRDFVRGLDGIGAWAPDTEPEELPQRVVVVVRIPR